MFFQLGEDTAVEGLQTNVGNLGITWGRWMGTESNPILVRNEFAGTGDNVLSFLDAITEPLLFATVAETGAEALGQLSGVFNFHSHSDSILLTSDGNNDREVRSSFNVDFENGNITNGFLQIGPDSSPMFRVSYGGLVRDGATLFFFSPASTDIVGGQPSSTIDGRMRGVFAGSFGEGFLQGFSIYDSSPDGTLSAAGYVVLDQGFDLSLAPVPDVSEFTRTGFVTSTVDASPPGDFDHPFPDEIMGKMGVGISTVSSVGRPVIGFSDGPSEFGDLINQQYPPHDLFRAPSTVSVTDFEENVRGYDIAWGRWNQDLASPVLNRHTANGEDVVEGIHEEVLFATVGAFDTNSLTGTASFQSTGHQLLKTGDGISRSVSSIFDVNFDTNQITNGHLLIGFSQNELFSVFFSGSVDKGQTDLSIDPTSYMRGDPADTGVGGKIGGTFAAPDGSAFLESFSVFDTNDPATSAAGFVILEQLGKD